MSAQQHKDATTPSSSDLEAIGVYPPHRGFWLTQLPATTKEAFLDLSAVYCAYDLEVAHGSIVAVFGHKGIPVAIGQIRTVKADGAKFLEIMTFENKLLRRVPRHAVCRVSHMERDV